ncbi:PPOX class F420-dependent oxidoreductase [Streptomyces sp. NBC_00237]|uniref:PPOX class F420-dependent oxidoreductase n=1 Tax=Streptomyces sp. NBC_00237 TaxID=2975687 RepID=UPI002253D7B3|nr:PPOX class F420-dependent oxidoreductase [Streptomyces sp. NBC_00237]MCX5200695.1 PPOX class F420-dependent oxidoreductase [Streptomyces sp. NBC_00237]
MSISLNTLARKLFDGPNVAVLATVSADGSPQTSPVWVGRDGDELLVSTQDGRLKVRNMRRDPRVSLTVYAASDPGAYVEVRGVAEIAEDEGRALAVALAEKYEGAGAGEEYLRLPETAVRLAVRIVPTRVVGYGG